LNKLIKKPIATTKFCIFKKAKKKRLNGSVSEWRFKHRQELLSDSFLRSAKRTGQKRAACLGLLVMLALYTMTE
jgi:hypothetical protein